MFCKLSIRPIQHRLFKEVKTGTTILPGSDVTTEMYESTIDITSNAGFEHYEVSNFARDRAYSRHNSGHWQGVDYLGEVLTKGKRGDI